MPFEAPLSTSVIPPVNALIADPTAPEGAPASSATVRERAVSAKTGASLTAVTATSIASVALEKAVVPPLLAVVTFVPAVPLVWSQAQIVNAALLVPL